MATAIAAGRKKVHMPYKHSTLINLGLCVGFAGACSNGTTVDASTAQAAMSALVRSVDTSISGYQGKGDSATKLSLKCAGGGAADVQGHVSVAVKPVAVDVALAIAYSDCRTMDGTTMNGDIDFKQTVVAGQTPVRVQTVYEGNVVFTGKVDADCPVDVTVLVDEAGKAVKVTGAFCGNDAAGLKVEVSPRWQG